MGRSFSVGGISPNAGSPPEPGSFVWGVGCGDSVFALAEGEAAGFALYKFVRDDTFGSFCGPEADARTARGLWTAGRVPGAGRLSVELLFRSPKLY